MRRWLCLNPWSITKVLDWGKTQCLCDDERAQTNVGGPRAPEWQYLLCSNQIVKHQNVVEGAWRKSHFLHALR